MSPLRMLAISVVLLQNLAAAAATTVTFSEPEKYRDASLDREYRVQSDEPALRELGTWLGKLGDRYLDGSESLQVEVLDVDLAGRFEPWRPNLYGVRIMDSVAWPVITLRYTLSRDGKVEQSAEERIADPMYLGRQRTWFSGDRLGFEKRMLDEWFRSRFAAHSAER